MSTPFLLQAHHTDSGQSLPLARAVDALLSASQVAVERVLKKQPSGVIVM